MMGVGLVVILAGAYLLYFEAGFDRWISIGVLGAGLLLFVGLAVMSFAGGAPTDPSPTRAREDRTIVVQGAAAPAPAPTTVNVDNDSRRQR
ncbi:MAG: hypothetical protein QOJ26_1073 [Thermoplasmata archaeon]|jgi:hypothetical protein|nr:hypothetical protein [Thermoplasmata archaeon]MEA3166204.1 hypothetical protein [Thermoplasmata archaeon]